MMAVLAVVCVIVMIVFSGWMAQLVYRSEQSARHSVHLQRSHLHQLVAREQ
jgi:hypothetical protein